jgi:hypothetical protein
LQVSRYPKCWSFSCSYAEAVTATNQRTERRENTVAPNLGGNIIVQEFHSLGSSALCFGSLRGLIIA